MKGHGGRQGQQVGLSLVEGLQHRPLGRVGSQVIGVPALDLEKVGHHAHADLVQFAADTGGNQAALAALCAKDQRVELGHDELRGRRTIVFLGHADPVQLPQTAHLALHRLKDVQVDVFDRDAPVNGV